MTSRYDIALGKVKKPTPEEIEAEKQKQLQEEIMVENRPRQGQVTRSGDGSEIRVVRVIPQRRSGRTYVSGND